MAAEAHLDHNVSTGPAWGALALDVFMIENWSSSTIMLDSDQQLALVRKYLEIGSLGRQKYAKAAGTVEPTEAQIETILRPLRSPALRSIAQKLSNLGSGGSGPIWIRTDYEDEERHQQFCLLDLACVDSGDGLREDSIILSDQRYYNVESWRKVLDCLPEIVVDHNQETSVTGSTYRGGHRRHSYESEYTQNGGELTLACQQYCCVCRFVIIEDAEMYTFNPPRFHALWLDDCGDVVRQNRITAEDANDYCVMELEGAGQEQEVYSEEASIGPKYVTGAEHGPPFKHDSAISLAQDLHPIHI